MTNALALARNCSADQQRFARAFAQVANLAEAYRMAFPEAEVSHKTAYNRGWHMWQSPNVQRYAAYWSEVIEDDIKEFVSEAANYIRVGLRAPRTVVQIRIGCCRHCWGESGRYQWTLAEYLTAVDEVEHYNLTKARGQPEKALPDASGGFDYDKTAPVNPECLTCRGEGVRREVVRDTTELSAEETAILEGVELGANGSVKAKYPSRSELIGLGMKLFGVGAENINMLIKAKVEHTAAPEVPADPMKAAEVYRDFMQSKALTGPSQGK